MQTFAMRLDINIHSRKGGQRWTRYEEEIERYLVLDIVDELVELMQSLTLHLNGPL